MAAVVPDGHVLIIFVALAAVPELFVLVLEMQFGAYEVQGEGVRL